MWKIWVKFFKNIGNDFKELGQDLKAWFQAKYSGLKSWFMDKYQTAKTWISNNKKYIIGGVVIIIAIVALFVMLQSFINVFANIVRLEFAELKGQIEILRKEKHEMTKEIGGLEEKIDRLTKSEKKKETREEKEIAEETEEKKVTEEETGKTTTEDQTLKTGFYEINSTKSSNKNGVELTVKSIEVEDSQAKLNLSFSNPKDGKLTISAQMFNLINPSYHQFDEAVVLIDGNGRRLNFVSGSLKDEIKIYPNEVREEWILFPKFETKSGKLNYPTFGTIDFSVK